MPYKDRETQRLAQRRLGRAAMQRKTDFVTAQKLGRSCLDCGATAGVDWPATSFDFDHRDRSSKSFKVSGGKLTHMSEEGILREIEKCDVRCANCHRERTEKERHYMRK